MGVHEEDDEIWNLENFSDDVEEVDNDEDFDPDEEKLKHQDSKISSQAENPQELKQFEILKDITKNFQLTFSEIRDHSELKVGLLKDLSQK